MKQTFEFIAGNVYGGLDGPKLTFSNKIKLRAGINKLALLSVAVGLPVSFFPNSSPWGDPRKVFYPESELLFVHLISIFLWMSECWSALRDMERWGSRSGDTKGSQLGNMGHVEMEMVLQGVSSLQDRYFLFFRSENHLQDQWESKLNLFSCVRADWVERRSIKPSHC